jgi:hypothetical protein
MSKKKAQKPDGAKKGPAPSNVKVMRVTFERKCEAEITLAVPEITTGSVIALLVFIPRFVPR